MNTAAIAATAARLADWAKRRAVEPSTWIGLGMAATSAGYSVLGDRLTSIATILPMILGAAGAGLAAASTSTRPADPTPPAASAPPNA